MFFTAIFPINAVDDLATFCSRLVELGQPFVATFNARDQEWTVSMRRTP